MAKHESVVKTLGELINLIGRDTDTTWFDVIGITIDGLSEAESRGEDDDFAEASEIEAKYIREHDGDKYQVSWPSHVTSPRFNSDAYYQECE